jgi:hypothetical protein
MTISGFFKFANDLDILSDKECGLNVNITGLNFYNNNNTKNNIKKIFYSDNSNFNSNNNNNYCSNKEKDIDYTSTLNLLRMGKDEILKEENNFDNFNENENENFNEKKRQFTEIDYNNNNNNNNNNSNFNKITKSELSLIFHNLSGVKNFDISSRIKSQFDKNKGYNTNFENTFKGKSLESKNLNKADYELKALKMNFTLFMKSFEFIASKIYKDYYILEALDLFFDNNIQKILKSKNTSLSLKKYYEEILGKLRREDIVNNKSFKINFFNLIKLFF